MVQLKLRLKATTPDSFDTVLERLRTFSSSSSSSSSDQKPIKVTTTDCEEDEPWILHVAFEFDVAGDEAYSALGEQCRAWLDGSGTGSAGVVEGYELSRDRF